MSEEQNTEQKPQEVQEHICPRCTYNLKFGEPGIKEDIKQNYVRTLLGDALFTWSVKFGGIDIKFQDLNRKDSALKEHCKKILASASTEYQILEELSAHLKEVGDVAGMGMVQQANQYGRMMSSISSTASLIDVLFHLREVGGTEYNFVTAVRSADPKEPADVITVVEGCFSDFQEAKIGIIVQMSDMFRQVMLAVQESCYDSNFWEGAGFVPPSGPTEKAQ